MGIRSCRSPKSVAVRRRALPLPLKATRVDAGSVRELALCSRWRPRLIIMVKAPLAGQVKTRLARGIGAVAATRFYRHASAALVTRLARDRRWDSRLAVAPDTAAAARFWPHHVMRMAQGRGDLGRRMRRVFKLAPPGPVVVIGSDCTDVVGADIAAAFAGLGRADAVIGPASDGGYWLIGARGPLRRAMPFDGIRWSSAETRADTLANFKGRRVAMLRQLDDVDEPADLVRVEGSYQRRVPPLARSVGLQPNT